MLKQWEHVPLLEHKEVVAGEFNTDDGTPLEDHSDNKNERETNKNVPYPKCVFFILSTETCERFSYYGMRTILAMYLRHLYISNLGWDNDKAENVSAIVYHGFVFLSYFTSLFGAYLADSFLGKFKTIFYISIVYALGQLILSVGALPDSFADLPQLPVSYLGLLLIGLGTGGIKPCVVAFGADQFVLPQQEREMQTFFGVFYASINFGSMISTILTPIFRKSSCFGNKECYSLAFGVPSALMVVAIVFFVMGRPWYRVSIPEGNVVKDFFLCIYDAINQRRKSKVHLNHWLDYAQERFGASFVSDVKAVLRVSVIFCLYPLFWALYDQQGSRWTFQATRMDGRFLGLVVLPDQMQVINAALILIFIPIFDRWVYPFFNKRGLLTTPLQKVITGGFLLAFSFVISAMVEFRLESTYPNPPDKATARLAFHNGILDSHCDLNVSIVGLPQEFKTGFEMPSSTIPAGQTNAFRDKKGRQLLPLKILDADFILMSAKISLLPEKSDGCLYRDQFPFTIKDFKVRRNKGTTLFVYIGSDDKVGYFQNKFTDEIEKSDSGHPWIKLMVDGVPLTGNQSSFFLSDDHSSGENVALEIPINDQRFDSSAKELKELGRLKFCLKSTHPDSQICALNAKQEVEYLDYEYGASYNIYVVVKLDSLGNPQLNMQREIVTAPNSIHMFWLLPQYIVLTAGEVLFSITSLQFAFTQAPASMKSVVQALYLLTTAFGDLIDIIVIASFSNAFSSQAHEFLLFAGLMVLDLLVLTWLATKYEYMDYNKKT